MKEFNAIVLVDEPGDPLKHYATMVFDQKKRIETRMKRMIPDGDIVICCGDRSMTKNKGLALCIVTVGNERDMTYSDEKLACIEAVPGRIAYDLSNWRYFSRKFKFSKYKVGGSFQSIFTIRIPANVEILPDSKAIQSVHRGYLTKRDEPKRTYTNDDTTGINDG